MLRSLLAALGLAARSRLPSRRPAAAAWRSSGGAATSTTRTFAKTIRITADQWNRIENAAKERKLSANQSIVELAIESLD